MRELIREYWAWVLVPIVLVVGGLTLLYVLAGGQGPPGIYDLF